MRRMPLIILFFLALGAPTFDVVRAQQAPAARPVIGSVAAGTAGTIGDIEGFFDRGWHASVGATFRVSPTVPVGLRLDLAYARLPAVDQVQVEDGHLAMTTLVLDVLYEFGDPGQVGGWFGAGVGGFHRGIEVTSDVPVGSNCLDDIGFPICPPTPGVTEPVESHDQLTQIGFDFDAAISFPLTSGSTIYLEARYMTMRSEPTTEIVPIVVGFRF